MRMSSLILINARRSAAHPAICRRGPCKRLLPAMTILLGQSFALLPGSVLAADLPETIVAVKRSVVAVGTFMAVRAQQHQLHGTGFVVAGNHAVTNAHVVAAPLAADRRETYALFLPAGKDRAEVREASLVRKDEAHDLALLRFSGAPLPALRLGKNADLREGETIAFTGYPVANALGLFPVTHRGHHLRHGPGGKPGGCRPRPDHRCLETPGSAL